ncbi:MAG: hypothetical protein FWC97_05925 [Treponema sp.]|nr:hypothetical protein [Treponema sp.]
MNKGQEIMKNFVLIFLVFSLLLTPLSQAAAQAHIQVQEEERELLGGFDVTGFPQWAKDLRRWNIITFGLFPFSMFFTTFTTDMIRWNNANNFDFSSAGRRYAPWPLKSAGGAELTSDEYRRVVLIAAGLAASVALVDLAIVRIRRGNERRRLEARPAGTIVIERVPMFVSEEDEAEISVYDHPDNFNDDE